MPQARVDARADLAALRHASEQYRTSSQFFAQRLRALNWNQTAVFAGR